jgi:two-component system chemotaxis sensor kinase CheA
MPHVDGGELAEKIRERDPNVPILVSSGYPEEEAMKHFAQSGINAFIQKPFQVEVLIAKIQELTGIEG